MNTLTDIVDCPIHYKLMGKLWIRDSGHTPWPGRRDLQQGQALIELRDAVLSHRESHLRQSISDCTQEPFEWIVLTQDWKLDQIEVGRSLRCAYESASSITWCNY